MTIGPGEEVPRSHTGRTAAIEGSSSSLGNISTAVSEAQAWQIPDETDRNDAGSMVGIPPAVEGVDEKDEEGSEVAGIKRARLSMRGHEENTLWSKLEEELQEKIISRLPITSLYRALMSSKLWLEKLNSRTFQREISNAAIKWPVFCPVHVNNKGLIGYDNDSLQWSKLFSFQHIPAGADRPALELCSGAGSLICFARNKTCQKKGMSWVKELGIKEGGIADMKQMAFFRRKDYWVRNSRMSKALLEQEFDIYVTNVLTKQWRLLTPRPKMQRPHIIHMTRTESGGYSVILLTRIELEGHVSSSLVSVCAQIYDSTSDSWTEDSAITSHFQMRNSLFAYSDNIIYIMCLDTCKAYNLEHRKWNDIPLPEAAVSEAMAQMHSGVVVCNSNVMLVMAWNGVYAPGHSVKASSNSKASAVVVVYKLDQCLQEFVQVSRGPPDLMKEASEAYIDVIAGHGDYIYFGSRYVPGSPVLKYNFRSQQWSSFPPAFKTASFHDSLENLHWANFAFHPGLHPFAEV
ncbi:hypothetical protein Mapa_006833 [Marchantia paleacea]|nr:hypothetical protein Mapa_006833 [Marchantia paleacea]